MHFLQLIQHELCHPEAIESIPPRLHCKACGVDPISCIYDYVQQPFEDKFHSSHLAQAYYAWTGDEHVPMTFVLVEIEGILGTKVKGQPLHRIRETVHLLRAINAPFTSTAAFHPDESFSNSAIANTFFEKYLNAVSQNSASLESEKILNQLLRSMHEMIRSDEFSNPFQFYFEKLVPFVKSCVTAKLFPADPERENLAEELLIQLQRSSVIRKVFGIYSIPFDIVHVMLGCYCCSTDVQVVSNWALDLMARVCRGNYFWKRYPECRFVQTMQRVLNSNVSYKKRTHLYHIVRSLRDGTSAECLSENWPYYLELQKLVCDKYQEAGVPESVLQMATNQFFPAVLFENNSDQLGFMMGLSHILITADFKNGIIRKGAFKEAREIHKLVMKCVEDIKIFDEIHISWTLDTLEMFLISRPSIQQDIKRIIQFIFTTYKDEE